MTYLKIIIILENKTGITNKCKDKGKGSSAPFSMDLFIPQNNDILGMIPVFKVFLVEKIVCKSLVSFIRFKNTIS